MEVAAYLFLAVVWFFGYFVGVGFERRRWNRANDLVRIHREK